MAVLTVVSIILGYTVFSSKNQCEQKTANLKKEILVLNEILKEKDNEIKKSKEELKKSREENEKLIAKLKEIEEKIKNANELLQRKGIKVTLPQGGVYIPADSKNIHIYAKKIEYRMDKLLKIIQDIPVGVPLYGRITSKFGSRIDPFNGKIAFHTGLDLRASFKQPIFATANGIVEYAGWAGGYGKLVKIKHKYGYETYYGHLYYIKVKKGQRVKAGQIIGYAGSTGRSTGVHLHYEIRRYGKLINPLTMLYLNNKNRL
jgi:murein DD-endopeptidase MepM/ murein hydrolase activator NlpD